MNDIMENMDFNYVHILRLLYSQDDLVQLLAGEEIGILIIKCLFFVTIAFRIGLCDFLYF